MTSYKCCICGRQKLGQGNNPAPIVNDGKSKCCDDCNFNVIVPRRLYDFQEEAKKIKKENKNGRKRI